MADAPKIVAYEIWKYGERDGDALTYQDLTVADCAEGYIAHPLIYLSHYETLSAELEQVKRVVTDINKAARQAADAVGVTPNSDMRPFVEQAVKFALAAHAEPAGESEPVKHGPGCGSHNDYPCDCQAR